jgi:hypothetical protein
MKKLLFVLAAAVLLFITACDGPFVDPGTLDMIGGGVGGGGGRRPAAPKNVKAVAQSSSSIRISWNAVSGADEYNVYRSTSSSGYFSYRGYTRSTSYTDSGLSSNTTYYYKVSAENDNGESAQSSSVSATTPIITYTVTFSINGGTGTAPASRTVNSGTSIILPNGNGFSRTDYTFGGWNTSSSGGGNNYNAGASYTVNSSTTLYAKWLYNGPGGEGNPIPLTAGTWADGNITSTASGSAIWYSFEVTSGTTYYVWWNDGYSSGGNGSKTLDIYVSAYYSNGSSIFTEIDSAWSSAKSFTANSTGTVKLKVYPYTSGRTGTFGIVYSTSGTIPSL